jgi:hypothetical protein
MRLISVYQTAFFLLKILKCHSIYYLFTTETMLCGMYLKNLKFL